MLISHKIIAFSEEREKENNLPCNKANLQHIFDLCEYQADKELKLAPKLKRAFLEPSHFQKMSVYEAYQVLNAQVDSALEFLV